MEQKKLIPKFKKKLTAFLTEEAGSIRRENILAIGTTALLISGGFSDQADALTLGDCHTNHTNAPPNHSNDYSHTNGAPAVHSNTTPAPLCYHDSYNYGAAGGHASAPAANTYTPGSDNKIFNGHYNQVPNVGSSHVNRWHGSVNPYYYVAHHDDYVWHSNHVSHTDGW